MKGRGRQEEAVPLPLRREQVPPAGQQRSAELLRQLEAVPPLSDISVARIRRQLERASGAGSRFRLPRWFMAVIVAAAVLFFLEVAAAATMAAWPAVRHRFSDALSGLMGSRSATSRSTALQARTDNPEDTRSGLPLSAPPSPGGTPVTSQGSGADVAVPNAGHLQGVDLGGAGATDTKSVGAAIRRHPKRPIQSAVGDETGVLAQALTQLHARNDPEGALGMFEAYGYEHPNGSLRGEAMVGQVEALLALSRNAEALALLDAMQRKAFVGIPRVSSLRLLRAELLGKLERCNEAIPALAAYTLPSAPASLRERALLARASCRARLKDIEGSRADLQAYLRDFPNGPFVPRAMLELDALH